MRSPAAADSLEAALERAVARYDDGSATSAQIRYHLGLSDGARRGKRLRSRLVLEVTEEEGGCVEDALDVACAVEILHEFSLVHDDIEDGDTLRRGRETVWSRFGIPHGINAGDALCAIAYLALLDGTTTRSPATTIMMARALQQAHLAMCGGQGRDIAFETTERVTMTDYRTMIAGKTGALFGAACELGALAAGAGGARASAYARIGRAYGIAFQIEDDILGTWGDSATTGKPCGADIAKRKWSFPVVWALGGPPSPARETVAAAYGRSGGLGSDEVAATIAALDALGARDAARGAARRELDGADEVAAEFSIDRSGRVRAFFNRAVRRVA
ncbi:MAG: polyprenyl synthetase family protein [Candidatus Eremiobacteraeota bacterium]|nr:polyprenyl synthetase family protein [Candidatus Eremiobacteraeota bacterium]